MGKIASKVLEVLVWVVLYLIAGLIDARWELRELGKRKGASEVRRCVNDPFGY